MRYAASLVAETLSAGKMSFLSGPRQVGKTTLAKALLGGTEGYFNWDVESHRKRILRAPEAFFTPASGPRTRLVLDEIHKYPRWKRFLKGLFDARRDELELLVTGSGRLDVYQKGGDSLLGRYEGCRLHPFTVGELLRGGRQEVPTAAELGAQLDALVPTTGASEALAAVERFTGFPEPLFAGRDAALVRWRRTRQALVVREDLRDLTRIREIGLVEQLMEILPERVGSPLSVNALREDLGVAFDTVKGWLGALMRLHAVFELRPFAGSLARTWKKEAKVYLFDPSVIEAPGPRFENLVALHLLKLVDAWNDRGDGDFALHYVRDKERREVDFVITRKRKAFWMIECKLSGDTIDPSLPYFATRLGAERALQVVRRGEARRSASAAIVPADRFLSLV
jgi:predicted AAA+ superfamily ATPase